MTKHWAGWEDAAAVERYFGHKGPTPPRGKPRHPEADMQRAVVSFARDHEAIWPELAFLFHPANGELRGKATGAILVGMGVKPGVPDLILPAPRRQYPTPESGIWTQLWLEMKAPGRKMSERQEDWARYSIDALAQHHVCYSAEQARDILIAYLGLPRVY